MQGHGDNFIYVIPFCPIDLTCPCHEDQELLSAVNIAVTDGLLTPDEAIALVQGRTV
jgi:hypothetical protein